MNAALEFVAQCPERPIPSEAFLEKCFQEPELVFVDPVARYARHLHPLVSNRSLGAVDLSLSGWIYLLSAIEPYDGMFGRQRKGILGTVSAAQLAPGLRLEHVTCRLRAAPAISVFLASRTPVEKRVIAQSATPASAILRRKRDASFAAHKAAFREMGQIYRLSSYGGEPATRGQRSPNSAVRAPVGNMIWTNVAGSAFTYTHEDAAPRTLIWTVVHVDRGRSRMALPPAFGRRRDPAFL